MKLIIHMGYPKTATTTLQNAVLEKLSDELDVELIVVLRNQADLLESLYHEMYYAFSKVDDLNTPEKFIKALNKNEYEDFFNNFNFETLKKLLKKVGFKKIYKYNCRILI